MDMKRAKLALLCMQRHSWEQGVAMQAFWELGDEDTVIALCKEAAYRRLPDGRLAIMDDTNAVTDPCSVGEALQWAARTTGDGELRAALDGLAAWALRNAPRNASGVVYHVMDAPQFWIDSMYMLPPFLAAIGEKDEAMRQLTGYEAALQDPATSLMAHQWDDQAKRLVQAAHWGVGNGWALAAYARLISLIPEERPRLTESARRLIDALLPLLTEDGRFYNVVDDPRTFPEGNLSQILCYVLCRGMNEGWLSKRYGPTADRLRQAALQRLDDRQIAQGVCGAPTFDKPGVAPEAQAFLLMMENQWQRWRERTSR